MSYIEDQRLKAVNIRDRIFKDPGNGIFMGKERDFVLSEPNINLWEGIRFDAIDYFKRNKIAWWKGEEPTGHLLSSQIACLNHLYFLRQREDLATEILRKLDNDIIKALTVDDGYVEFEFIGNNNYLKEKSHTRGANCTSIDAVMIGLTKNNKRKIVFIEWKYTESYSQENKYIPERSKIYDPLIETFNSPLIYGIPFEVFYYEPFYQLMRQTLLAWECVKNNDHNVDDYLHVHVVPDKNEELKYRITSPMLKGKDIHKAWKSVLKDDDKFLTISPNELLSSLQNMKDTKSILYYLNERYW